MKKILMSLFKLCVFLSFAICLNGVAISEESTNFESETMQTINAEMRSDESLYIIANVEGKKRELLELLVNHGLVDSDLEWLVSGATIVLMGNLNDSENSNLEIIKAVQLMQSKAKEAGNQLKVILGEKDVEFIQLQPLEQASEETKSQLSWLAEQDYIIQSHGQVITNGGISARMSGRSVEEINQKMKSSLRRYLDRWSAFSKAENVKGKIPINDRMSLAKKFKNSSAAKEFLKLEHSSIQSQYWPLRYKGNSFCHPLFEQEHFSQLLSDWKASRLWSATSLYPESLPASRFDKSLMVLGSISGKELVEEGAVNPRLWIAKIDNQGVFSLYQSNDIYQGELNSIVPRHYNLPYGMSVEEIKEFMRTAEVEGKTETKEGRTKPLKLKLTKDGKSIKAIFKYVNEYGRKRAKGTPPTGDKFEYELAAYQLSEELGIGLVPIAVERVVANRRGVVQLWIDGLISAIPLNSGEAFYDGYCDPKAQENFINTFDYLIMNVDRNQTNITFTKADWQIWFIDHTRAFGRGTRVPPFLSDVKIKATTQFKEKLKRLSKNSLKRMSTWLSRNQIDALWERRNRLLKSEYIQEK